MATNFTHDKALHSLNVANFMKAWAPKLGLNPDDAWVIGWLHDVGYTEVVEGHNEYGAHMLGKFSTELAHYISVHDANAVIQDDMEFLLHLADFVVDETGKHVGINERIKSINLRNGFYVAERLESEKDYLWKYAVEHGYSDIFDKCL